MLTIARLFGKSPFAPLQTHMKRVTCCIEKLSILIDTLPQMNLGKIEKLSQELCALEQEADQTKNDIRNHLPKSLFLPIDRSHLLDILSIQDSIADKAEEIGILLSFKNLEVESSQEPELMQGLTDLKNKSLEAFNLARKIIEEIEELLESSFGGLEAEKVKQLIEETSKKEEEAHQIQQKLMKRVISHTPTFSAPDFYLWVGLTEETGAIAEISERLANKIRMILELK